MPVLHGSAFAHSQKRETLPKAIEPDRTDASKPDGSGSIPELARNIKPVAGLISAEEIEAARKNWHAACEICFKHATHRSKEIQRLMRVHRDPFEPIMCVLEAESPLAENRKITEEIIKRMPDERRYPRAAAEAVRSFLMLRLGLHLGLLQKNLRQLPVCPRRHFPTPERRLEEMKRGELRWSERDRRRDVLIPSKGFKNANSSFFGAKPFRLILPDLLDLYTYLNAYIDRHRGVLLAGEEDPGTLFVKTVKTTSKDAAYNTPDMVAKHYGRFLPQDKSALAARILNQVWEAA